MSGEIKEFVTDFFVMRNDEADYASANCERHSERCATSVIVALKIYGREVIAIK